MGTACAMAGTSQAGAMAGLLGVGGLVHVLVLDEGVVALDLHAPQLAEGLKVVLQVALARLVHVKVHHKERGRGLRLAAAQVLALAHLPVALQRAGQISYAGVQQRCPPVQDPRRSLPLRCWRVFTSAMMWTAGLQKGDSMAAQVSTLTGLCTVLQCDLSVPYTISHQPTCNSKQAATTVHRSSLGCSVHAKNASRVGARVMGTV